MKLWKKKIAAWLSVCFAATSFAGTAWAAEDRTKISSIRLNIESSIEVGIDSQDVTVTTESDRFYVEDVEVTNDDGEWLDGETPRVEISLGARNGYYFSSRSSSIFDFDGDDADFVSASITNDKEEMTVTVKLDPLVGNLEIESAGWEEDESPIAVWEEADGAKSYQIRLYRGSSSVTELITTTNNYYNFAGNITKTGDYSYKVRAVNSSSKRGSYIESDSLYVEDDVLDTIKSGYYGTGGSNTNINTPGSTQGGWIKDQVGWWYRNSNGTYTTNGWQYINNQWYAFDNVGYMRTGWIPWNGVWYYCDAASGAMLTNARTPDGYWVNADGVWIP